MNYKDRYIESMKKMGSEHTLHRDIPEEYLRGVDLMIGIVEDLLGFTDDEIQEMWEIYY